MWHFTKMKAKIAPNLQFCDYFFYTPEHTHFSAGEITHLGLVYSCHLAVVCLPGTLKSQ